MSADDNSPLTLYNNERKKQKTKGQRNTDKGAIAEIQNSSELFTIENLDKFQEIINDIEQLKRNNPNTDDSQKDTEFNNRLTKVQEFCLETNLEMMKIKKQVDTLIEFMNTSNKTNVVIHEEECSNLSEND